MNNQPPKQQRQQRRRPNNMSLKSIVAEVLNKPMPSRNRNARRNRNRRALRSKQQTYNVDAPYVSQAMPYIVAPSVSGGQSSIPRNPVSKTLRNTIRRSKVTSDGLSFLKCAFAPPDFSTSSVRGVPDNFGGNSLCKKHRFTSDLVNAGGRDTYILVAPVPGIAYFVINTTAGAAPGQSTVWNAVPYPDARQLFRTINEQTTQVSKFRYVSQHFELMPTVNAMNWSGSITAWKVPLQVITRSLYQGASNGGLLTLTGMQGCAGSQNAQVYTGPVANGYYGGTYSANTEFNFCSILDQSQDMPAAISGADFGQLLGDTIAGFPGFDNGFESLCIRISNTGAENTFVCRNFACVEYIANPGTSIYEYQSVSCSDPIALALYKEIIKELPIGVHYLENDSFWRRVLNIIRGISGSLSVLPGPYGAIAGGVNAVSTGIDQLTM